MRSDFLVFEIIYLRYTYIYLHCTLGQRCLHALLYRFVQFLATALKEGEVLWDVDDRATQYYVAQRHSNEFAFFCDTVLITIIAVPRGVP